MARKGAQDEKKSVATPGDGAPGVAANRYSGPKFSS